MPHTTHPDNLHFQVICFSMHLSLLGINHETAPVDLRERVAFAPETMADALRDARQALKTDEVVILSTCNRTEIYAALEPEHARMLR